MSKRASLVSSKPPYITDAAWERIGQMTLPAHRRFGVVVHFPDEVQYPAPHPPGFPPYCTCACCTAPNGQVNVLDLSVRTATGGTLQCPCCSTCLSNPEEANWTRSAILRIVCRNEHCNCPLTVERRFLPGVTYFAWAGWISFSGGMP